MDFAVRMDAEKIIEWTREQCRRFKQNMNENYTYYLK